jgi:hypothetical protein
MRLERVQGKYQNLIKKEFSHANTNENTVIQSKNTVFAKLRDWLQRANTRKHKRRQLFVVLFIRNSLYWVYENAVL